MEELSANAFRLIVLAADRAFKAELPGSDSPLLTALSVIEGQCRVLREVHGEGDGLGAPELVEAEAAGTVAAVEELRRNVTDAQLDADHAGTVIDRLVVVVEDLLDSLEADHYNANAEEWDEESAATSATSARDAVELARQERPV